MSLRTNVPAQDLPSAAKTPKTRFATRPLPDGLQDPSREPPWFFPSCARRWAIQRYDSPHTWRLSPRLAATPRGERRPPRAALFCGAPILSRGEVGARASTFPYTDASAALCRPPPPPPLVPTVSSPSPPRLPSLRRPFTPAASVPPLHRSGPCTSSLARPTAVPAPPSNPALSIPVSLPPSLAAPALMARRSIYEVAGRRRRIPSDHSARPKDGMAPSRAVVGAQSAYTRKPRRSCFSSPSGHDSVRDFSFLQPPPHSVATLPWSLADSTSLHVCTNGSKPLRRHPR